jgi:probable rRNA maturation factor
MSLVKSWVESTIAGLITIKNQRNKMEITVKNIQNILPVYPAKIKKLIKHILKNEGIKKTGYINICFVDNPLIKKFNAKFLKSRSATDVLAFDLSEKKDAKIISADIIISAQAALKQANVFKTTPDYELSLYVAHGILHILGYDDQKTRQIKQMRRKEKQYVN